MKVKEFLTVLNANPEKALFFEYKQNEFVGANYHITEIKNVAINSVDCGGRSDEWNETIIQLWESPKEIGKIEFMKVDKALSILEKVNGIRPLLTNTELKFEYGNANFHTAALHIDNINLTENNIVIQLFVAETDCKAKELCIVPESNSMVEVNEETDCCSGTDCC